MTARSSPDGVTIRARKDEWRRRLVAARRALPPQVHAARARALTAGAVELAATVDGPVCAYLPIGTEPGSPALVEVLRAAGHEVVLPVVPQLPGPLDWARFEGVDALVAGPLRLRQPAGARLGPAMIERAGLVLVPALAADRGGARLGRGGGFYDRTLPLAAPATPLVVLLNDDELVSELPAEPHDHRVSAALLADAGFTTLGNRT
ncbi:5-formyltetrahydrofolate cyclo-ligase [Pseudonocardia sp. GCM10023141]|uniref:5-formyltetrahydrofolate cyclo-ligase n=1 Tax=Pseudonocardia sp. GCM10023141 TaxID=3252653 RepID=UPI0036189429